MRLIRRLYLKAFFLALSSAVLSDDPKAFGQSNTLIHNITGLNPIQVDRVIEPETTEEIKEAVKKHAGSISIGGARYSIGGQIATEHSLHFDMRRFNKIISLDPFYRTITVQSGVRWRDILEAIDPLNLSIRIMQTYANFTVGGSLGVNVHGRYIGEGALVRSVASIKVVLADGSEVFASPKVHSDIFNSAIGGYGGIGIITEATFNLTANEKVKLESELITLDHYKKTFYDQIRNDPKVVFHNGDIYPPNFQDVRLFTWRKTDEELTNSQRLIPRGEKYWLKPQAISIISTLPFGAKLRSNVLEPLTLPKKTVVWRNYEASYDVGELEPSTPRQLWTYALQEYFVPVEAFDRFVPRMRKILRDSSANIVNISIRHALPDTDTFLSWAPHEVFSFVIYYKQSTSKNAQKTVGEWTRKLIDEAIAVGGSYYLPYQIHATTQQFKKAYNGYQRFFDLKAQLDPSNKFRNKLWDTYYRP